MPDPTSSPSIYRPRSPRASPLWQIVHHSWNDFLADYESKYRKIHGPLRPFSIDAVNDFYKCGDLSAGFVVRREAVDRRPEVWEMKGSPWLLLPNKTLPTSYLLPPACGL
jgi:hypothetical protein